MSASLKLASDFLGKEIDVVVDRPLGSKHPKHGFIYEANYGYIPDTKSPDGEELDAYYLGVDSPLEKAKGFCIAIIHRTNDDDDKLVVVAEEKKDITDEEINKEVEFQEKFFEHLIIREDPYHVLKYKDKIPHRKGVIGIIINNDNEYLITQSINYNENDWRFAGGGIDEGENAQEALMRELREELGSEKFDIIQESVSLIKYDWPDSLIVEDQSKKKRLYRGQEQKQYLVKFSGRKEEIKIDSNELRAVKWVKAEELSDHFTFRGQWKNVEAVLKEFNLLE